MADTEPGEGWSDIVSKILRMGTNEPESNRILSKAKIEDHDKSDNEDSDSGTGSGEDESTTAKDKSKYGTTRLKPRPQADALQDNELKSIATRGVVAFFNSAKTSNPKSDKLKKKKKKKKRTKKKKLSAKRGIKRR